MRKQKGEHPRMGATDVCPLVPVSDVSMDECIKYSKKLNLNPKLRSQEIFSFIIVV